MTYFGKKSEDENCQIWASFTLPYTTFTLLYTTLN